VTVAELLEHLDTGELFASVPRPDEAAELVRRLGRIAKILPDEKRRQPAARPRRGR